MKKKLSSVTKTIVETAEGMKKIGLIDEEEYQKITMRLLKKRLQESIKQSKEGRGRIISSTELDEMVKNQGQRN